MSLSPVQRVTEQVEIRPFCQRFSRVSLIYESQVPLRNSKGSKAETPTILDQCRGHPGVDEKVSQGRPTGASTGYFVRGWAASRLYMSGPLHSRVKGTAPTVLAL